MLAAGFQIRPWTRRILARRGVVFVSRECNVVVAWASATLCSGVARRQRRAHRCSHPELTCARDTHIRSSISSGYPNDTLYLYIAVIIIIIIIITIIITKIKFIRRNDQISWYKKYYHYRLIYLRLCRNYDSPRHFGIQVAYEKINIRQFVKTLLGEITLFCLRAIGELVSKFGRSSPGPVASGFIKYLYGRPCASCTRTGAGAPRLSVAAAIDPLLYATASRSHSHFHLDECDTRCGQTGGRSMSYRKSKIRTPGVAPMRVPLR